MRRIVSLVLTLVAAAAAATAGVLLIASPASARDRIVAAALAQKSVHYTWTHVEDMGGPHFTSIASVNAESGIELKKFYVGAVQIRFVDHTVYVRGNVQGLVQALSLSLPQAERYAGRWISISRTTDVGVPEDERIYDELADGLTLDSIVHDFASQVGQKLVESRRGSPLFLAFEGKTPDGYRANVSARANGEPLPVQFTQDGGPGSWTEAHFSGWKEPVHVRAPKHAVPIATVRA